MFVFGCVVINEHRKEVVHHLLNAAQLIHLLVCIELANYLVEIFVNYGLTYVHELTQLHLVELGALLAQIAQEVQKPRQILLLTVRRLMLTELSQYINRVDR